MQPAGTPLRGDIALQPENINPTFDPVKKPALVSIDHSHSLHPLMSEAPLHLPMHAIL